MYLVNIEDVRPGQVVAKAVTSATGAVLCPPGFQMTATAIERLKNAGVTSVIVEGLDESRRTIAQRLEELHRRFAGIDDPLLIQLKAAVERRLSLTAVERGENPEA